MGCTFRLLPLLGRSRLGRRPALLTSPCRLLPVAIFFRLRLALLAVLCCSCQPEIGDSCSNASDCSVQEQRTCDTTYPGGYCTVLGCVADSCPEEARCVAFQSVVSIAPECASLQVRPRLQRTVCMRACANNDDCRGEYQCVDMSQRNAWGATAVDRRGSGKVCALPPPPEPVGQPNVCAAPVPAVVPALTDAGSDARTP